MMKKGGSYMSNENEIQNQVWGNPVEALDYYMKALAINEQLKDSEY